MAVWHQLIERSPGQVWAVLADPGQYSRWVVGVADSQPGRGAWPEMGAELGYRVVFGPWSGNGRTTVRRCEPPAILELEADSGRLGTARIAFDVRPWGEQDSLVIVDEHPLRGPAGALHNVALDLMIQLRHRSMLGRLAALVEAGTVRAPEPSEA
jgi:uncharacterized protein YndB with AHSA1/START domain